MSGRVKDKTLDLVRRAARGPKGTSIQSLIAMNLARAMVSGGLKKIGYTLEAFMCLNPEELDKMEITGEDREEYEAMRT